MADYTIYDLTVSVLTPLHIGTGRELLNQYDYAIHNGRTWRLNESALLDAQDVEDAETASTLAQTPPAQLLRSQDFRPDGGLFRYVLRGTPRSGAEGAQLREQIKDAFDRPYLPGSSLKGALRTALAWNVWQHGQMRPEIRKIGRRRQWAAQTYEKEIFGRDPNHDFLRALHVSDSAPVDADQLLLLNASVMNRRGSPGAPIEMEAVAPDTQFSLTLKVDDALFSEWAVASRLRLNGQELLTDLPRAVQNHSLALARQEVAWFKDIGPARQIAGFYQQLAGSRPGARRFLITLGWGTGWTSKTFGPHLQSDADFMERILRDHRLARGRRQPGDPFPKSRRVVVQISRDRQGRPLETPAAPMGWCLVEMKERNR
ncbi:MAG: type III-A CRISPR-associated RAMP protein Csm5 [Caldilineaceae bacterium SB0661_bin_32]|uniref:CRISPR system Cms protein Csm5 n=1 Tax=Caldilineaceae bacterium SB0661_bin_32 TaxID=2605255 RepID=A0A6B1D8D3_9CHLR|nr:type III-A CRISPR-associated RAMP protein Csm5 [Caldilineaceae bacterium SB0661_bin_32]